MLFLVWKGLVWVGVVKFKVVVVSIILERIWIDLFNMIILFVNYEN